jgi:low affinity Fe/Cu permease
MMATRKQTQAVKTFAELYQNARLSDLSGRSEMGRDELAGKLGDHERPVDDSVAGAGLPAQRSPISRWLSRVDWYAATPLASVLVISGAGAWILVSIAVGFPARWETIFQTAVAALTLVMVFVIQHTQARHQRATQRKLDEILLAMPGTDTSLLTIEHASDDELRAAGHQHREIRQAALDGRSGRDAGGNLPPSQVPPDMGKPDIPPIPGRHAEPPRLNRWRSRDGTS